MMSRHKGHDRVSSISLSKRNKHERAYSSGWILRILAVSALLALLFYSFRNAYSTRPTNVPVASGEGHDDQHLSRVVAAGEANLYDAFLRKKPASKPVISSPSGEVPEVLIRGGLPSLDGLRLESPLRRAWQQGLDDLATIAELQYSKWFLEEDNELEIPSGIPGTGIDTGEEARELQEYLDCTASEGAWVYDPSGEQFSKSNTSLPVHKQSAVHASCDKASYRGNRPDMTGSEWDVRPELKWHWNPSKNCKKPSSSEKLAEQALSRQSLCKYLRHKHILMIGDAPTQYFLHDLLLDWTSETPLTCYGDLYCKEHGICGGGLATDDAAVETWESDQRVYDRLPDPPTRSDTSDLLRKRSLLAPNGHSQAERDETSGQAKKTWGTILRYRRSDSLFLNSSPSHPRNQPGFIHPDTGIRDVNMYAVPDSRRSDIIIISKAPVPVPLASNTASSRGKRLAHLASDLEMGTWKGEAKAKKALELALALTKEIWLPELMESLHILKAPPAPQDNLITYRGAWRMQPQCASSDMDMDGEEHFPLLAEQPTLKSIFAPSSNFESAFDDKTHLTDMRSLVYNLQVIIQNHIVRNHILPNLGIVFLDMESATSVWKGGFVGGANGRSSSRGSNDMQHAIETPGKGADCLRMCLPSPGLALEHLFIGALNRLFEQAWNVSDRDEIWLAPNFMPVRERMRQRKEG